MKKILTLFVALLALNVSAQVNPGMNMQGSITGGTGAVTQQAAPANAGISMQDMERFGGVYQNGRVSDNGDRLNIEVGAALNFAGTIASVSEATLRIDGYDNVAAANRTLEITVGSNEGTPVELYIVRDIVTNDSWVLYEDPFNPKN